MPPTKATDKAKAVARFLTGYGVTGLRTSNSTVIGLSGVRVKVSGRAVAWDTDRMDLARNAQKFTQVGAVVHVNRARPLEDALITMRLEEWAPLFAAWVEKNKDRLHMEVE